MNNPTPTWHFIAAILTPLALLGGLVAFGAKW